MIGNYKRPMPLKSGKSHGKSSPHDPFKLFGERLMRTRLQQDLTREELSIRSGLTLGAVERYEEGTRTPTVQTVQMLARFFKVSAAYLAGETDDPDETWTDETDNSAYAPPADEAPRQKHTHVAERAGTMRSADRQERLAAATAALEKAAAAQVT